MRLILIIAVVAVSVAAYRPYLRRVQHSNHQGYGDDEEPEEYQNIGY